MHKKCIYSHTFMQKLIHTIKFIHRNFIYHTHIIYIHVQKHTYIHVIRKFSPFKKFSNFFFQNVSYSQSFTKSKSLLKKFSQQFKKIILKTFIFFLLVPFFIENKNIYFFYCYVFIKT